MKGRSMWNNVMREYAEEFLGLSEAQGQSIEMRQSSRKMRVPP